MTDKNWRAGNKNAAKPADEKRVMLSVRLPADLIEQLKARGNVTAQIEAAIIFALNKPIDN
jgi:uncharacterized protein (DUF4415 family)